MGDLPKCDMQSLFKMISLYWVTYPYEKFKGFLWNGQIFMGNLPMWKIWRFFKMILL
jgi:hypothetical protein